MFDWIMDKGYRFALAIAVATALLVGAVTAVAAPLGNHSDHVSCLRLHEQTGLPTRYARSGMSGECYIQVGQQWVPEDRWRNITTD